MSETEYRALSKKLDDLSELLTRHIEEGDGMKEQLLPIIEAWDASKFVALAIKWVFGTLIAVGTLVLTVRQLTQ